VLGYLGRRLAWAVVPLVGITLVVFSLVVHLSGSPTAL
jgi:hypothetical protein